jgi:DNA-binding transcriptional regulator YhcF (GntR family)
LVPKATRPDNGDLFPVMRREPLSRRVAQLLKQHILVEGLPPGHRLPAERRLADRLNVSRTVLREALSLLIGEGIVERRSAHALCVADFDRARVAADFAPVDAESIQMRDLIELRAIIELGSIETIVQRVTEAQLQLAALMLSPDVQVNFNLKKGSLPIRGDVNLDAANACMKKGIEILANPDGVLPSGEQLLSSDTQQQLQDLLLEFFSDKSQTVDDLVERDAEIIASAD